MPELPEVETIRAQLQPEIRGRSVTEAWAHESAKFTPALDVVGATFGAVRRRGKYLLIALDGGDGGDEGTKRELVVHLGMTGVLGMIRDRPTDALGATPYVRAEWLLDNTDVLRFKDVRRFGRLRVVPAGDYSSITTLHALGPEPLEDGFLADEFYRALRHSNRRIKTQLLSQIPVAGVGNIYADEAMWRARIYPARRSVTKAEAARLHEAIIDVLAAGVENGGTTLRDYRSLSGDEGSNQHQLDCYGRAGHACPRCNQVLQSRVWDARTTTFCPRCQPR